MPQPEEREAAVPDVVGMRVGQARGEVSRALAERQDVPPEFIAIPALVSASALVGRRVGVQRVVLGLDPPADALPVHAGVALGDHMGDPGRLGRGLHQMPVEGEPVHRVVLRQAAHPRPLRQPAVDQAVPVINTPTIALGSVRVGDASPMQFVSVTNQATGNVQAALNARSSSGELATDSALVALGAVLVVIPGLIGGVHFLLFAPAATPKRTPRGTASGPCGPAPT